MLIIRSSGTNKDWGGNIFSKERDVFMNIIPIKHITFDSQGVFVESYTGTLLKTENGITLP